MGGIDTEKKVIDCSFKYSSLAFVYAMTALPLEEPVAQVAKNLTGAFWGSCSIFFLGLT